MRAWVLCLSLGLLSAGAQASVFKSECNLDKAVKNEALNATLGVKGNCDTDKLVRQQKEKAKAEVKKNTTDVLDQKTAGLKEGKSQLQGTQQKVNQAGQQLKQTQQDVKAVAKDPLKAAATAVINQGGSASLLWAGPRARRAQQEGEPWLPFCICASARRPYWEAAASSY